METVINKTNDSLKVYLSCVDSPKQEIPTSIPDGIPAVGPGSSTDAAIICNNSSNNYVLVCAWHISANKQSSPSLYAIINIRTNKIEKAGGNLNVSVAGTKNSGYVITFSGNNGASVPWWVYLLLSIFVIVFLIFVVWYAMGQKGSSFAYFQPL
jgi:hypothetical protein